MLVTLGRRLKDSFLETLNWIKKKVLNKLILGVTEQNSIVSSMESTVIKPQLYIIYDPPFLTSLNVSWGKLID